MNLTTKILEKLKASLPNQTQDLTEGDLVSEESYEMGKDELSEFISDRIIFSDLDYFDAYKGEFLRYHAYLVRNLGEIYILEDSTNDNYIILMEWSERGEGWSIDLEQIYVALTEPTTDDGLLNPDDLEPAGTKYKAEPSDLGVAPLPEDLGDPQPFLSVVDDENELPI